MTTMDLKDRVVTVHLGLPKTASTSIQRHLAANAEGLAPELTVFVPERGSALNRAARQAIAYSLNPAAETKRRLVAAIRALRRDVETAPGNCLISHENLVGAHPGRETERGLFPAAAAIVALIDQHFAPMRVSYVVYTRAIDAWKRSVHGQAVKMGRYNGSLDTFLEETQAIRGWDDLKQRLTGALGDRVTFFDLETGLNEESPSEPLLRHIGVSSETMDAFGEKGQLQNVKLTPSALEFIRLLNMTRIPPAERKRVVKVVKQNQSLFSSSFEPSAAER